MDLGLLHVCVSVTNMSFLFDLLHYSNVFMTRPTIKYIGMVLSHPSKFSVVDSLA